MKGRDVLKRQMVSIFLALLSLSAFWQTHAAERPIVAVFEIEGHESGIKKKLLTNLTNFLAAKLTEGGYQVIPQAQIRHRLRNQKNTSYQECFEQNCQIEIGRELAAQKSLSSRIMKIGNRCQLTATLYDLRKSAAEQAATARGKCDEDSLLESVEKLALKLCAPQKAANKQSAKVMSDFEKELRRTQKLVEKQEREKKTWDTLSKMVENPQIPASTRAQLLQKFIAEFGKDKAYSKKAYAKLVELLPGKLIVDSEPRKAQIKVNGVAIGKTPIELEYKAGEYRVESSLNGFETRDQVLSVNPGKVTKQIFVMKDLRPGVLILDSQPRGAKVLIKGGENVIRGKTPFSRQVESGDYQVEINKYGYASVNREVSLKATQETKISLVLKELPPGEMVIKTQPPGAMISWAKATSGGSKSKSKLVWNKTQGETPLNTEMRSGPYLVRTSKPGYADVTRSVQVVGGQKTEISISLLRDYPMNPYKKWGHIAFWSGVGLAALGGIAMSQGMAAASDYKAGDVDARDSSQTWAGVMYGSFGVGGALLVSGAVLWAMSPGDQQWQESRIPKLAAIPTADGIVFSLGGRW